MYAAKCWDELWVEEKFQTNTEIAGSPRNVFRYSLRLLTGGGIALDELADASLANSTKLRMPSAES